jgi:cytochrome c oxidase subunit 2
MKKYKYIGAGIFILVVLFGIWFGLFGGNFENSSVQGNNVREITIDAQRFAFSSDTITVKQGEVVRVKINNLDGLHGMRIPELGIYGDNFVEFSADKKGEFMFYCNNYCGEGHSNMQGKIIVE